MNIHFQRPQRRTKSQLQGTEGQHTKTALKARRHESAELLQQTTLWPFNEDYIFSWLWLKGKAGPWTIILPFQCVFIPYLWRIIVIFNDSYIWTCLCNTWLFFFFKVLWIHNLFDGTLKALTMNSCCRKTEGLKVIRLGDAQSMEPESSAIEEEKVLSGR